MARRAAVHASRKRRPRRRGPTLLDQAKTVLRRSGCLVYDGAVEQKRFAGKVVVDGRIMEPEAVIARAQEIIERETTRNNELRAQHGLPPIQPQQLRG